MWGVVTILKTLEWPLPILTGENPPTNKCCWERSLRPTKQPGTHGTSLHSGHARATASRPSISSRGQLPTWKRPPSQVQTLPFLSGPWNCYGMDRESWRYSPGRPSHLPFHTPLSPHIHTPSALEGGLPSNRKQGPTLGYVSQKQQKGPLAYIDGCSVPSHPQKDLL